MLKILIPIIFVIALIVYLIFSVFSYGKNMRVQLEVNQDLYETIRDAVPVEYECPAAGCKG